MTAHFSITSRISRFRFPLLTGYFSHELLDKYRLRPSKGWYLNFPEQLQANHRIAIPPLPVPVYEQIKFLPLVVSN
jgi:hypothetical protein